MSVKIETGSVKDVAERTNAEAIVNLAFGGVEKGEAKLADSVPADATYKYVIKVRVAEVSDIRKCYEKAIKIAEEKEIHSIVFPLLGSDDDHVELAKIIHIALGVFYETESEMDLILAMPETVNNTIKENISSIDHDEIAKFISNQERYNVNTHGNPGNNTLSALTMRNLEDLDSNFPSTLYDELEADQDEIEDDDECRGKVRAFFAPFIDEDRRRKADKNFSRYTDYGSIDNRYINLISNEDDEPYMAKSAFIDLVQGKGKTKPSKDNLVLAAFAYELDINQLDNLLYEAGYALNNSLKDRFIRHAFENGCGIEDIDSWLISWDKGDSTFAANAAKRRKRAKRKEVE